MLRVAVLLAAVCYTQALMVCPPNACSVVRCASVTADKCNGRIAVKGGFCGCCDQCVSQIKEGESCASTLLLGAPLTAECADGHFCHRQTGKCTKETCAQAKKTIQARLDAASAAGRPILGLEVPDCESDGSYKGKQCAGSRCFCVSATGEHIQNFAANRWEAGSMDCNCARELHEYQKKGLIGKLFSCDVKGGYEEVQCTGSVCYCADDNGKQLLAISGVHISKRKTLDCKKAVCAKEYTRLNGTVQAALARGEPRPLGLEMPKCRADGTYDSKQCRGSQCKCVEAAGSTIDNIVLNRWETKERDCACVRARHEFQQSGEVGKTFNCDEKGGFKPIQCRGSACYCVDHTGAQLKTVVPVHVSQIGDLMC